MLINQIKEMILIKLYDIEMKNVNSLIENVILIKNVSQKDDLHLKLKLHQIVFSFTTWILMIKLCYLKNIKCQKFKEIIYMYTNSNLEPLIPSP